jgi:DNA invertase Pin-like site-specific DNA recombinase
MSKLAVAYLRVSTATNQDGHGFDRQSQTIKEFCQRKGFSLADEFREVWTGREQDRPVLSELISSLEQSGASDVIVESSDRLARDLMVQFQILGFFAEQGIRIWNAITGEDMTEIITAEVDPIRKAMVQVQAVFSELEKRRLVLKLKKARDAQSRVIGKRCEGRKALEWSRAVIMAARRLRSPNKRRKRSLREVTEMLNKRGYRRPDGLHIEPHNVRSILQGSSKSLD